MAESKDRTSSPSPAGAEPRRRPIPLPPASLRPSPRVRRPQPDAAATEAPAAALPAPELPSPPSAGRSPRPRWARFVPAAVILVGLLVAVGAWRLLTGPPPEAQAVRTAPPASRGAPEGQAVARGPEPAAAVPGDAEEGATRAGNATPAAAPPRFTVQVASFRTRHRAEATLARASESTGLAGMVVPSPVDGIVWQRILLGAFATEEEAETALAPLLREGFVTEIVVRPIEDDWLPALTGRAEDEEVR